MLLPELQEEVAKVGREAPRLLGEGQERGALADTTP